MSNTRSDKKCSIEGCDRPHNAKGFCMLHYRRWNKHGEEMDRSPDPLKVIVYTGKDKCIVDGCDSPPRTRDMCDKHYMRWKRHGDPTYERPTTMCKVEGCGKVALAKELCRYHYYQRRDKTRKRKRSKSWQNGHGYINLYRPDHPNANKAGRIKEHTFVMSDYLGRPLKKGEFVHHKNGIKNDNNIENLELWTRNHPTGSRAKDLLEWADSFVAEYSDVRGKL